jgi:exosome complex RNA-binding protein Csl4
MGTVLIMRTKRVAALATGAAAIVGGLVVKNKKQKARAQEASANGASSNGLRTPTAASSMMSQAEDEYADLRDS